MDSELARAYSNLAEPGDRELFQRAIGLLEPHEARPGDTDTQELIDSCRRCLALPGFEKNFRQRTKEPGQLLPGSRQSSAGSWIRMRCGRGEKYELILSADGNRSACSRWSISSAVRRSLCWSTGISWWDVSLSGIFAPGRGAPGAGGGRAGLDRAQGGPGFPDSLL